MRLHLSLHPDSRCEAVESIAADVSRRGSMLDLHYRLTGRIADLRIPPHEAPARTDNLWQHTCFEAFARAGGEGYRELNLSPSSRWAAYRFDGYRSGMAPLEVPQMRIDTHTTDQAIELTASIHLDLPPDLPWRLNLTAVVEDAQGRISYWAYAHPPGKADFHHPDGFQIELPPS